jgi:hypothetical protein
MIEIQYLESTENLRRAIKKSHGWQPSLEQAEGIAACLRQGRLFFEAAKRSPLEIRPLELFYGASAYAKALVLASDRTLALHSLAQSHGVADKSPQNARLGDLLVQINRKGTFPQFNDCLRRFRPVVELPGLRYHGADSASLCGATLSLKDILGRIPGIGGIYRATFYDHENVDFLQISDRDDNNNELWTIAAPSLEWPCDSDHSKWQANTDEFFKSLDYCQKRYPFLKTWSFKRARLSSSGASISFVNIEPTGEFVTSMGGSPCNLGVYVLSPSKKFELSDDSVGPLFAVPTRQNGGYFVQPIDGQHIAMPALQFLGLYLLSSLVRYRPATWMHSLSGSSNNGRPADDAMLALIEAFMRDAQSSIPTFVAEIIRPGLTGMSF